MKTELTELLQERINNEAKQKRITIITATLFSLFSLIIIGLGVYTYSQKKVIVSKNKELSNLNWALKQKTIKLDSMGKALERANSRLTQDTATLSRSANNFEKMNTDMQKAIKNIYIPKEVNHSPPPKSTYPTSSEGEDGVVFATNPNAEPKTKPSNIKVYDKTNKAINEILKKNYPQGYTIYIQYMQAFVSQSANLKTAFEAEKYIIPLAQNMKTMSFPSSVRYFYKTDEAKAMEIAQKAEEVIHKKFKVQYINLKSPKNQLEIWVGK